MRFPRFEVGQRVDIMVHDGLLYGTVVQDNPSTVVVNVGARVLCLKRWKVKAR